MSVGMSTNRLKICLSVSGSVLFVILIITVMLMLLSIFFVSD